MFRKFITKLSFVCEKLTGCLAINVVQMVLEVDTPGLWLHGKLPKMLLNVSTCNTPTQRQTALTSPPMILHSCITSV